MNYSVVLIFFAVWLFLLWIGSVALERTGLDRSSARFQALSAFTNTGFTTTHAETIVGHPARRRIVSILIMLGSSGVVTFLVLIVLAVRTGLSRPAIALGIFVLLIAALALIASKLGLVRWVTDVAAGRGRTVIRELDQGGGHSLTEIRLGQRDALVGKPLSELGTGVQVLFLERADGINARPAHDEVLRAGDRLVCYGPTDRLARV
ncbi:MAG: TrkA C-terminal domain-containing protein [Chloroflexi bacterium]|nr:TrkA C-terminal domain-containing protein [Chloroflexota bacterium]